MVILRKYMNIRGREDLLIHGQDSSDGMICTYCKEFPNIAGPSSFISGNKSYRIDGNRSHFSSPKHLQCCEAYFAA
jgi:hypothetical protein